MSRDYELRVHKNISDPLWIKNMEKDAIFFVTNDDLMRSFDYGTKLEAGIALYMMRYPRNQRLLEQAYGRVGRNNTRCQIFEIPGLRLDQLEEYKAKARLFKAYF